MSKISDVVAAIEVCQASSMQCWEMAVDTAEKQADKAEFQADADACDENYDESLACIHAGDLEAARGALQKASDLEKDGGDNQHAQRAIDALDELTDSEGAE